MTMVSYASPMTVSYASPMTVGYASPMTGSYASPMTVSYTSMTVSYTSPTTVSYASPTTVSSTSPMSVSFASPSFCQSMYTYLVNDSIFDDVAIASVDGRGFPCDPQRGGRYGRDSYVLRRRRRGERMSLHHHRPRWSTLA